MSNNTFEFPDNVFILLILCDEVHEFIVHDNFLVLVIVDRRNKLMVVIRQFYIMLMAGLE
jgi:hypothetical protein